MRMRKRKPVKTKTFKTDLRKTDNHSTDVPQSVVKEGGESVALSSSDRKQSLTCTEVKPALEGDELQLFLKFRSLVGLEVFKLFQNHSNPDHVTASVQSAKVSCQCVKCGKSRISSQKVLNVILRADEPQFRCDQCVNPVEDEDSNLTITQNHEKSSISISLDKDSTTLDCLHQTPASNKETEIKETTTSGMNTKLSNNVEKIDSELMPISGKKGLKTGKRTENSEVVISNSEHISADSELQDSVAKSESKPKQKRKNAIKSENEETSMTLVENPRKRTRRKKIQFFHSEEDVSEEENIDVKGFRSEENKTSGLFDSRIPVIEQINPGEEGEEKGGGGSHVCNICGRKLLNAKTLRSHMSTHMMGQTHTCKVCGKMFTHLRYLKKHEKTHIKEKPYICEVCGQRFKLKESLPKHMILHGEDKPFKCHICHKQFHLEDQMKKHVLVHSDEKKFICELCGKQFRTRGCMKSHRATHDGPLKHSCQQCGKSYRSAWYLKIHEKTHTGENLIQCKLCDDWFVDPCYFKLHQKKFCKGKTITCDKCGIELPHNQALQSHMGLHTGERPYGCKTCGKAFAKSSLLAEHVRRHTLENCLNCQFCKKGFINLKELKRHEKCHIKKKKKGSLPDNLKPGRSEQIEVIQETEMIQESHQVQTADANMSQFLPHTEYVQVDIQVESDNTPVMPPPDGVVSVSCVQYIPDHTHSNFHQTDSISLSQAGASTQVLSSRGGHITLHEPMNMTHQFSDHLPTSSLQFSPPGYSIPPQGEQNSRIISTADGELQQLQPITASGNGGLSCESETSVHHLLQAAAIIKDYPSQY